MKKIFTVSVFALFASLLATGCEYQHVTLESLEGQREKANSSNDDTTVPSESVGEKDETVVPQGESDPVAPETDDDNRNPYLVCEDYETLTNCYWADPAHPDVKHPIPTVPADTVSDGESKPPYGCFVDPATGQGYCTPPPPPSQEDPAVVQPVNGFDRMPVTPIHPVGPVRPGIIIDPVRPRPQVFQGETATF